MNLISLFKRAIVLPVVVILLATPASAQNNPAIKGADPDANYHKKEYWIYPTNGGDTGIYRRSDRFLAYSSKDMNKWTMRGELLNMKDVKWIRDDSARNHYFWAPDVLPYKGKYYLYYSVGPQTPTPSRIGVAVSDSPFMSFVDSGKPLLTGYKGFEAIDPMVFIDPKTKEAYLYAGGSAGAKLRVFELKPNMTEIDREIQVEQPPKFTEGVFMHERKGIYYLSYSHGRWNDATYSIHYATSKTPVGPWDYKGAWLESDASHKGPGHHSFVYNDDTEQWYLVYHRWETTSDQPPFRGSRMTAIEKVTYNADGTIAPVVMTDGPAKK